MTPAPADRAAGPPRALTAYVGALVVAEMAFLTALAPLLPHYGLPAASAGILMAAYPFGCVLGALPAGALAARTGARPAVLLGLGVAAAAALAVGWSSAITVLVAARFIQGLAEACAWAGGTAWLAGETEAARRGEVLGAVMGFAAAGALAGPAFGGLASWMGPGPVFSAGTGVYAGLMGAALLLPRPRRAGNLRALPGPRVLRDRGMRGGVCLMALGGMAVGMFDVLAPLRLSELGAAGAAIAGTFVLAGAAEAALSPLVGKLSDRRGEGMPARLLLPAAGAGIAIFPLLGQAGWLALLLALALPACGSLCVPGSALLSRGADRLCLHQAAAFGLGNLAWSGGQAAAAAAAGGMAQAAGDAAPAALLSAACLVTLAAVTRLKAPGARSAALATGALGRRRPG